MVEMNASIKTHPREVTISDAKSSKMYIKYYETLTSNAYLKFSYGNNYCV